MKRVYKEWKKSVDNDAKAGGYRIVDYDLYERQQTQVQLLVGSTLVLFAIALILAVML